MARIRSIKPELLEDERTAQLTNGEWRLFVSLLLLADDYGNLRANPKQVGGTVFWGTDEKVDVAGMMDVLELAGLISLYNVRGQTYAHLCGWSKHQKVDKPGKPLCPGPEEQEQGENGRKTEIRESVARVSRDVSEVLAPDLDLDQDQELISAELAKPAPAPPVLIFPVVGKAKEWGLTTELVAELSAAFPALDILAECSKAKGWAVTNRANRKTPDGMPKFLFAWLARAQNSNGAAHASTTNQRPQPGRPIRGGSSRIPRGRPSCWRYLPVRRTREHPRRPRRR